MKGLVFASALFGILYKSYMMILFLPTTAAPAGNWWRSKQSEIDFYMGVC